MTGHTIRSPVLPCESQEVRQPGFKTCPSLKDLGLKASPWHCLDHVQSWFRSLNLTLQSAVSQWEREAVSSSPPPLTVYTDFILCAIELTRDCPSQERVSRHPVQIPHPCTQGSWTKGTQPSTTRTKDLSSSVFSDYSGKYIGQLPTISYNLEC